MEGMLQELWHDFNEHRIKLNPNARPGWSPQLRGQWNGITALLKESPRQDWLQAIEGIEHPEYREIVRNWISAMDRTFPSSAPDSVGRTRPTRQARSSVGNASSNRRRSTRLVDATVNTYGESDEELEEEDLEEESEVEDEGEITSHIRTSPHNHEGHVSNNPRSTRRGSSTSHANKCSSSEASHDMNGDTAVKKEDLHKHTGRIVHHRGNQFYRPGPSPHGIKGTKLVLADGELLGLHELSTKDAEDLLAKAEKNNFGLDDPRGALQTAHYNNGRRKSSLHSMATETLVPAAWSSGRRVSKADPTKIDTDDVARGHSGRRLSIKSSVEAKDALMRDNKLKTTRTKSDPDVLLDKDYVDARPNEIFHHRGQGKWARGLPPPGSSNKMAVRGPNAKELFDAMQRGEEIDENGKIPPPITALLRREEGPDLYPQYQWHYRGGGKHCRLTKEEAENYEASLRPAKKQRTSVGSRPRGDGPEAQLHRASASAADAGSSNVLSGVKRKASTLLQRSTKVVRKRSQQTGLHSKASSNAEPKAPTPRPPPLAPEDDRLTDADLPSLYKDDWSDVDEQDDEAEHILRQIFRPIVGPDPFVAALTKFDPAARSMESLKGLAANAQTALKQLQDEYLELDQIVARNPMHGKKERKPMHGGREPVSHEVWEDKKEAALYDYAFDARKIGFQDPDAQRIVRDAEGRELRRRRGRNDPHTSQVNYGDGEMTTRRTVKPVSRFDGVVVPVLRQKSRLSVADSTEVDDNNNNKTESTTPDRTRTPVLEGDPHEWVPPSRGRWAGHIPKRIQELRGASVSRRSESGSPQPPGAASSSSSSSVRKGRPPGSKNHHERKDKGIKKGPRKKKDDNASSPAAGSDVNDAAQGDGASEAEKEERSRGGRAVNPMSLDAIVGPQG